MSKHTWLTRPTEVKWERLNIAFRVAHDGGGTPTECQIFAGYCIERWAQGSSPGSIGGLWMAARSMWYTHSKVRLFLGKNAENYGRTWWLHVPYLLGHTQKQLDLNPDTPWQIVKDYVLDLPDDEQGRLFRAMWHGWEEQPFAQPATPADSPRR